MFASLVRLATVGLVDQQSPNTEQVLESLRSVLENAVGKQSAAAVSNPAPVTPPIPLDTPPNSQSQLATQQDVVSGESSFIY